MLKYLEIKNRLLELLKGLKPADRLPSRPELCKSLDTTRATLDKAIKELEQEGLLCSKNGSGTFIVSGRDKGKTRNESWGIIVPSVTLDTYPKLVRGVENVTQWMGINLILCNSDSDIGKQEQYIRRMLHSGVTGFIIVPVVSHDTKEQIRLYNQLIETNVPFVFCNRGIEGIDVPVVTSNNFYGGYIATKHLIGQGYCRIAYLSAQKYRTSEERCQGYISALVENGLELDRDLVIMQSRHWQDNPGYHEMKKLLDSGKDFDAVFCFNDHIAGGVYQALNEAGLKVSENIGIIGYDDTDIAIHLNPRLTSVSYRSDKIGAMAASLLDKIISGKPLSDFSQYLFQPGIIVRESCMGNKNTEEEIPGNSNIGVVNE